MKLLIATNNQGKLEDYREFCRGLKLEPVGLKDLRITDEFEEIYPTFEENAKAKAEFYYRLSGIPTLADDSGIEIDHYNGEPGVNTKHWDGRGQNDEGYLKFIVEKIKAIPKGQRQGQMRAIVALCINGQTHLAEGIIRGVFTDKVYHQSTTHGYPWDKVFILADNDKYYEELAGKENLRLNHRKLAFDKLKPFFN